MTDRETAIAAMADCAEVAAALARGSRPDDPRDQRYLDISEAQDTVKRFIIAEIRRRFGADDPQVVHHLSWRGLS